MRIIDLKEIDVLDYIKEHIHSIKLNSRRIEDAKFHHNTSYDAAANICKYGILTMQDLHDYKIKTYSEEQLEVFDDISSHANGRDSVSLSVVGLQDVHEYEDLYDPEWPYAVDFLISSDLSVRRCSINYGNEFLSRGSINRDYLRSIDVRLINLINIAKEYNDKKLMQYIVKSYNGLKEIARSIQLEGLNIPIREMSEKTESELDIDKLASMSKIRLVHKID